MTNRHALLLIAAASVLLATASLCGCSSDGIREKDCGDYILVEQEKGPTLGYSKSSKIRIIRLNGRAYKDLNGNGILDTFENWRYDYKTRARTLASDLGMDVILGLMMHSPAQEISDISMGKNIEEAINKSFLRHILISDIRDKATAAHWVNDVQAMCEKRTNGIPAVISSAPRNYTSPEQGFEDGTSSDISHWPSELGMAATFDPEAMARYGDIVSREYRALGITMAISQADVPSDPRWRKFGNAYGEEPRMTAEFVRRYCDAMQTTEGSEDGWGNESVSCMVGHWLGDGAGEGGRDASFGYGKYSVYPSGRFRDDIIPFRDGAFHLAGKTGVAAAVMTGYSIPTKQDPSGRNVGSGFSTYLIDSLLRGETGYDGIVCTSWNVVASSTKPFADRGKPWGVESLTEAERIMRVYETGADMIGGMMKAWPFNEASGKYVDKYGQDEARKRFEATAYRLLLNMFNLGLFENPYVDAENAERTVGCSEFCRAGYEAQLHSIVMLKNNGVIGPKRKDAGRLKVWEPIRTTPEIAAYGQKTIPEKSETPIAPILLARHFDIASSPEEADLAVVYIRSPFGHNGYTVDKNGRNGSYCPISLQYGDYTAAAARRRSLAGDRNENRSYRGRTEHTINIGDMELVHSTRRRMGSRPVIVVVDTATPFVPSEIEPYADVLLLAFGVSNQAIVDIIAGEAEPSAMLPCQMPADMVSVENQAEDAVRDMRCYVDAAGNTYDFGFGMDWNGVINDQGRSKY